MSTQDERLLEAFNAAFATPAWFRILCGFFGWLAAVGLIAVIVGTMVPTPRSHPQPHHVTYSG